METLGDGRRVVVDEDFHGRRGGRSRRRLAAEELMRSEDFMAGRAKGCVSCRSSPSFISGCRRRVSLHCFMKLSVETSIWKPRLSDITDSIARISSCILQTFMKRTFVTTMGQHTRPWSSVIPFQFKDTKKLILRHLNRRNFTV